MLRLPSSGGSARADPRAAHMVRGRRPQDPTLWQVLGSTEVKREPLSPTLRKYCLRGKTRRKPCAFGFWVNTLLRTLAIATESTNPGHPGKEESDCKRRVLKINCERSSKPCTLWSLKDGSVGKDFPHTQEDFSSHLQHLCRGGSMSL